MSRNSHFASIDIGSTAIRVVVGQKREANESIQIIAASEHSSEGVARGIITSIEDATGSISAALEKCERMCGSPIETAIVGISGSQALVNTSKGITAIAKANGEISPEDVERAIEAAEVVAVPPNYKLLHNIPKNFTVDGQSGIKDPIGMTGSRLEVETKVIHCLSSHIENVSKCATRAGVEISEMVLGILAASEAVTTSRQRDLGTAIINIGAQATNVAVYENGDLIHLGTISVGGAHFTNDIAIGLRVSIDLAEKVKLGCGTVLPSDISKHDEIDLSEFGPESSDRVSHKHVAEILEARSEELFSLVNKELTKVHRAGLLPAGVALTGGGSKLPGLAEAAKKDLKLPASVSTVEVLTAVDKVNDPQFSTAVGLILWTAKYSGYEGGRRFRIPFFSLGGITDKVRKLAKTLMP